MADLHVWRIAGGRIALSAHLLIAHPAAWPSLLTRLNQRLKDRYHIEHTTFAARWHVAKPFLNEE